jgi:hypothetical protein
MLVTVWARNKLPDTAGRRSGDSGGSSCVGTGLFSARTLSGCMVTGRMESPLRRCRTMLRLHEVSRRTAVLLGFVVGAVRRRAKNSSTVLGMGRCGTMDLNDRDSQGQPFTRGHVSNRTSRPRPQLGHAAGSGFAGPFASSNSEFFTNPLDHVVQVSRCAADARSILHLHR